MGRRHDADVLRGERHQRYASVPGGGANYLVEVTETDSHGKTYDATLQNDVAGGLDPQFDSGGTAAGTITGDQGSVPGVAVQPDGSIVVVNPSSTADPVVRYDDTGAADGTTFDVGTRSRTSRPWPSSPIPPLSPRERGRG